MTVWDLEVMENGVWLICLSFSMVFIVCETIKVGFEKGGLRTDACGVCAGDLFRFDWPSHPSSVARSLAIREN